MDMFDVWYFGIGIGIGIPVGLLTGAVVAKIDDEIGPFMLGNATVLSVLFWPIVVLIGFLGTLDPILWEGDQA